MSNEEIVEGNKLIADFMGVRIGVDNYSWRPGCIEPLQEEHLSYNLQWGWLMPVVERIEAIEETDAYEVYIFGNCCDISGEVVCVGDTKIESVWKAVIAFIRLRNHPASNP